jgi:hypothetical protein
VEHSDSNGRIDASGWDGAEDTDPRLDLSAFDVSTGGPFAFAVVCDSTEHPDKRVPYRVSVEAGVAVEDVDPLGMVS